MAFWSLEGGILHAVVESECRLGQYTVKRELTPAACYLAAAPGGRHVVLKKIEEDCLLEGELHPLVHDRLSRVRELAHLGVGNLYGVERLEDRIYLVWEYVEGMTLGDHLEHEARPWAGFEREFLRAIEAMHALGIVHGAIHPNNIILTPSGRVRLTHVSPLLYNDPGVDAQSAAFVLDLLGCQGMLEGLERATLGELSSRLAAASREPGAADAPGIQEEQESEGRTVGRVAVVGAIVAALLGAAVALGIWRMAG
jgi:hypothetical protein